jgi:peptide/nickel transport system ATP-binding protein
MTTAITVRDLQVALSNGSRIVQDISFEIRPGEVLCIVGESGSGKSTISTALLAFARTGAEIVGGSVLLDDRELIGADPATLRDMRGRRIAYVSQDPASAFNPAMRIRDHLVEVLRVHGCDTAEGLARIPAMLGEVGLPTAPEFAKRLPHQLSGGQLQRVGIAMATILEPDVLVLDEPTTGLDVTTQARVLEVVRDLCRNRRIAALYVTHDLAVVADIADRVLVMRQGQIVETAGAETIFTSPLHEHTRAMLAAVPDIADPGRPSLPGSDLRPVLEVRDLTAAYHHREVVHGVSFTVHAGECVALVGESGSGKSTLSKCIVGLHAQQGGQVAFEGEPLNARARRRPMAARRALQYVFQSSHSSLNPRRTAGESIGQVFDVTVGGKARERRAAVEAVLTRVGLAARVADLLPERLSGGERQRVSIARALVCRPKVLVCDEITSALDVVVQAQILDLLRGLQDHEGLGLIFVTHHLAVVREIAHTTVVLHDGLAVEMGPTDQLLRRPTHPYTRQLIANTLSIDETRRRRWPERASDSPDLEHAGGNTGPRPLRRAPKSRGSSSGDPTVVDVRERRRRE